MGVIILGVVRRVAGEFLSFSSLLLVTDMMKWQYDGAGLGERLLPTQYRRKGVRNECVHGLWRYELGRNPDAYSWDQL